MGSHRVGHEWKTWLSLFTFMHWKRKWQPTPVFLPGESQGWGLPSMGSHRVRHDWSDLAAAATYLIMDFSCFVSVSSGHWLFSAVCFSVPCLLFSIHVSLVLISFDNCSSLNEGVPSWWEIQELFQASKKSPDSLWSSFWQKVVGEWVLLFLLFLNSFIEV